MEVYDPDYTEKFRQKSEWVMMEKGRLMLSFEGCAHLDKQDQGSHQVKGKT